MRKTCSFYLFELLTLLMDLLLMLRNKFQYISKKAKIDSDINDNTEGIKYAVHSVLEWN